MRTEPLHRSLSPQDYAALIDAAKRRAVALRQEAISTLWTTLGRRLGTAWHAVRRDARLTSAHGLPKAGPRLG